MKLNAGINGKTDQIDFSVNAYAFQSEGYRHDDQKTKSVDGQIGWLFDGGRLDWIAGVNESFCKYPMGLTQSQLWLDRTASTYSTYEANETDEDLLNTRLRFQYDRNDWLINAAAGFSRDYQDYDYFKKVNTSPGSYYRDERIDDTYDFMASAGKKFNTDSVSQILTAGVDYTFNDFEQDRSYPLDPSKKDGSNERAADIEAEKKIPGY